MFLLTRNCETIIKDSGERDHHKKPAKRKRLLWGQFKRKAAKKKGGVEGEMR
jgi:hypothetical protein